MTENDNAAQLPFPIPMLRVQILEMVTKTCRNKSVTRHFLGTEGLLNSRR